MFEARMSLDVKLQVEKPRALYFVALQVGTHRCFVLFSRYLARWHDSYHTIPYLLLNQPIQPITITNPSPLFCPRPYVTFCFLIFQRLNLPFPFPPPSPITNILPPPPVRFGPHLYSLHHYYHRHLPSPPRTRTARASIAFC